jgi:AraC-like DNA-binding protein
MKPQLFKVATGPAQSFSVRQDFVPFMNNKLHYHPEVELIHFKRGCGTQFIGDSIKQFGYDDVILVGAHLPHYWRFDEIYLKPETTVTADVRVAHFCENFWGDHFLDLPENRNIKTVLEKARRGIRVNGKTRQEVAGLMERMLNTDGAERIILLMEALLLISECSQVDVLSSIGFGHCPMGSDNDRINAVYEYSLANFKNRIMLEEIANVAQVSPNSFCRFFKSRTRKTYSQFLIEIKVGNACKLLITNKLTIKQICYESGFHNFASFHKYFKIITGKSPLIYQREFINS